MNANTCEFRLRQAAAELLESGAVALVIGYARGSLPGRTRPVFLTKPEATDCLVYNGDCHTNLTVYVPRLKAKGKIAVVARPEDVRTLVSLIQEKQIERDRVHVITFAPDRETLPPVYDTLIETETGALALEEGDASLDEFAAKTPEERWKVFEQEMAKCIRCYACRNACPMCYCSECFVERTIPRWVGEGSNLSDTMIFHITRALHSAGRCGECDACVRACPMGVNLTLLNRKINQDVWQLFGHKAGMDPNKPAALCTFDMNDYNDFIK